MKYLAIICLLMLPARSIYSQGALQFSADTVITTACEGFILLEIIDVLNTSDEDIRVRWRKKRLEFPHGGSEFMIAGGVQYLPGTMTHSFNLYAGDSTEVYFHIFPDTLLPGDSVIWQVLFFDENDSIETNTLLTAILVCPLSSDIDDLKTAPDIDLYPNPFDQYAQVSYSGISIDHVRIYDLSGRLLHSYPVSGDQIKLTRENLLEGLYFACFYYKGEIMAQTKMMVID